eukprot:jgi/Psemu1/12031/gm1.12031_g
MVKLIKFSFVSFCLPSCEHHHADAVDNDNHTRKRWLLLSTHNFLSFPTIYCSIISTQIRRVLDKQNTSPNGWINQNRIPTTSASASASASPTASASASAAACIHCNIPPEKIHLREDGSETEDNSPNRSKIIPLVDFNPVVHRPSFGAQPGNCKGSGFENDCELPLNPDGVVIELDPERLLRLTLDDASVRLTEAATTNGTGVEAMELIGKRWFGGDFLSAIETSKELDIPIFLGDEYPIETKQRFVDTVFDVESYNPRKLLAAVRSMFRARLDRTTNPHSEIRLVDVVGTFFEDPRKLLPLAATLSLPFLTVLFALAFDAKIATATEVSPDDGLLLDHSFEVLATLLSSLISFFAACKVFNNLIADRDLVVASNIQRAATTMTLLNSNQLIRKRWTFSVTESVDGHEPEQLGGIPLFTLKNPLERNAVRNLNLFEPRWLKMIDRLMLLSNPQRGQHPNGAALTQDTEPPATSSGSENRIIGCVTCTNKFYSAINLAATSQTSNSNPGSFVEGRYADVIFRRRGRFGELKSVTEGSRPSGARKVGAKIVGKESFDLSSSVNGDGTDEISVTPEGYLTALNLTPIDEDESSIDIETKDILDEINIVVVVGLLHANAVYVIFQSSF